MAHIKRLWLRSINGNWIVTPVGAGVDFNVRSFNVRDKHDRWLTATPKEFAHNPGYQKSSLLARTPGKAWVDRVYNPTLDNGAPHTPEPLDWTRLFYVAPRVDPNWRLFNHQATIRVLGNNLPYSPDNVQNVLHHALTPFGGKLEHRDGWDQSETGIVEEPWVWTHSAVQGSGSRPQFNTGDNSDSAAEIYALTAHQLVKYLDFVPDVGEAEFSAERHAAGMLDNICVYEQLVTSYPESFGVGQYTPIWNMSLRRVTITGVLTMRMTVTGSTGGGAYSLVEDAPEPSGGFDAVRFTLHAGTSAPGTTIPEWPYTPRVPINVIPFGPVLIDQQGLDVTSEAIHNGEIRIIGWTRTLKIGFTHTFTTTDITNNIMFTCLVQGAPDIQTLNVDTLQLTGPHAGDIISRPYPEFASAEMWLNDVDVTWHYATAGHDTPDITHLADEQHFHS